MKSEKKRSKDSRASQRRTKESKRENSKRSRHRSKEVREYQKSAGVSKIAKKGDDSESRISKNVVQEVVSNESAKTRDMKEEKWKSSLSSRGSGEPLVGEKNILRDRVNILQKLANR